LFLAVLGFELRACLAGVLLLEPNSSPRILEEKSLYEKVIFIFTLLVLSVRDQ
jgi:hypothetical protein